MGRALQFVVAGLVAAAIVVACSAAFVGDDGTGVLGVPTFPDDGPRAAPDLASPTPSRSAPSAQPSPAEPVADRVFVRAQDEDTLSDDELAALSQLPGIEEISARRTDDGALWSSRRSDGTAVDDLPDDFKVSVALAVAGPGLPVRPAAGEVVLTSAGQQFRDLDVGAVVELTDRVERTVVAVSDAPELDGVEFVVAAEDAASLDVRVRQRALLLLEDGADAEQVAAAVTEVLGPDVVVQPRVPDGRPLVLSLPATKARFGEFAFRDLPGRDIQQGASWIRDYIAEEVMPIIGDVNCNRLIIEDLRAALQDVIDSGFADEIDPALYGGCWSPRRINRNANLSRHAWGIGIDINVDFTEPGLGPIPSEDVIAAFERNGFRWGGDFPFPDNHHFEWVGR